MVCLQELVQSYQSTMVKSRGNSVTPDSSSLECSGLKLMRTLSLGNGRAMPNSNEVAKLASKAELHRPPSSVSLYGTDVVVEEQRNIVENIARHVVYGELKTTRSIE